MTEKFEIFKQYLAQSREQPDDKVPMKISLAKSQKEWLKSQPEGGSKVLRDLIHQTMSNDLDDVTVDLLVNILLHYDINEIPDRELLIQYANGEREIWVTDHEHNPICRKRNAVDYLRWILNANDFTVEEQEFLQSLKDNFEQKELANHIWKALENYLKRTEIRKGYPLLQFIHERLYPLPPLRTSYPPQTPHKRDISNPFTIKELADMARIDYQTFYSKHLRRLRHIGEWCGFDHFIP